MKNEQMKKRQMICEINTHTSPIWVPGIQGRKVWKLSFLSFFISDSLFVILMEFVINLAAGGSIWRVGDNTLPSDPGVRGRKSSILSTPAQHSPSQQNIRTNRFQAVTKILWDKYREMSQMWRVTGKMHGSLSILK